MYKYKHRHLILLIPPLSWIATIFFPHLKSNYFFITPLVFLWSYLFFYNFPFFVKILHSRPTYFEDLKDNTLAEEKRKLKYQKIFIYTLQFSAAIGFAILIDYWIYQVKPDTSWSEALGITGGLLGTFRTIYHVYGIIVLNYLKKRKKKVDEERIQRTLSNHFVRRRCVNGIEMVTINPLSNKHRSLSAQNISGLENDYYVNLCNCGENNV
jgi:hypothetical protein